MFRRRMDAGSANVRAATCKNSTTAMPSQMGIPAAGSGGRLVLGSLAKKGVRKYANGNRAKDQRKERIRPSFAESLGYNVSWRVMPMKPRMDMAQPTVGGGKERPPVNSRMEREGVLVRAVERKRSQREVNALGFD